jgi:outer membrane protein assembly factor BamA
VFDWPGSESSRRSSDIKLKGRITSKGQGEAESTLRLRWGDGKYYIKSRVNVNTLALRFYGIGPNTPSSNEEIYHPQRVLAYFEIFRNLFLDLKAGLRYEFDYFKFLDYDKNGILATESIRNTTNKKIFGGGVLLDWDTRDRKYSPTSGSHHQFFALFFDDKLGSEINFNNYNIDLRNYFSLGAGHVLATQFFIYIANGDPPFWRLAALGGRAHTRGYRRGRYLESCLLAFQGEYRLPVLWRLGLVGFAGLGDVAPSIRKLQFEHMRPSFGAGIRFALGSPDKVRARFDVGLGGDSVRFYVSFDEAF